MRGRGALTAIVSLLLAIAFMATPTTSAVAQGCTEQLTGVFLSGWSHDLPNLLPIFTDDVVYEDKTVGAVLHGKEELRDFAQGWFKAFPDLKFTRTAFFISGDRAAVEWVGTGTQKGDMPGMPASNKVASVPGVSIMECSDGKIKHNVDYWDNATLMRQLGFLPVATTGGKQ
jgi:steroid delta-isomerase-like uncharacterized protein